MLASISPLGERARRQRWSVTAGVFVLASTSAGGAAGAALGAAGRALPRAGRPATSLLLIAIVGATFAADLRWRGRRLPGPRRQVNELWLGAYRGWVYG